MTGTKLSTLTGEATKDGFDPSKDPEVGVCLEHDSLAERYDDGSIGCWWASVVESWCDNPEAFRPLHAHLAPESCCP